MAPYDNDPIYQKLILEGDARSATDSFSQLASVVSLIKNDLSTINDGISGIIERADQLKGYFTSIASITESIKAALQLIGSLNQGNETSFNNTIQVLNRMFDMARTMGGSGGNMGYAPGGGGGGGGGGGFGGYYADPTVYGARERPNDPLTFSSVGGVDRSVLSNNPVSNFFKQVRQRFTAGNGAGPGPSGPPSGGGGGGGGGGGTPPPTAGVPDPDDPNAPDMGTGPTVRRVWHNTTVPSNATAPIDVGVNQIPTSTNQERAAAMLNRFPTFAKDAQVNPQYYDRLGQVAGKYVDNKFDMIFGNSGLGQVLKQLIATLTRLDQTQREASIERFRATGPDGIPPQLRQGSATESMLKIAENVAKVATSPIGAAASLANQGHNLYNSAHNVMDYVRTNITGRAQGWAGMYGNMSYTRLAGDTMHDFYKSGFGLNPNYSQQDVQAARAAGLSQIGYKGTQLNNYIDVAMKLKQQYGITDPGYAAQIIGGGAGFGVGMNTTYNAYAQVRNLEASNTMTTQYGDQAFLQGMGQAAEAGFRGPAAAQIGVSSAAFGANDLVAQRAGMTGNEMMGTTLGYALTAQQLGVGFTQVYAAEQNYKGNAQTLSDKATLSILANLGVTPDRIKKMSDLNQYAMTLAMILPQLGVTSVKGPQDAVHWTWDLLKRYKNETSKHQKKNGWDPTKHNFFSNIWHNVAGAGKDVANAAGAIERFSNRMGHDIAAAPGHLTTDLENWSATAIQAAGGPLLSGTRSNIIDFFHSVDSPIRRVEKDMVNNVDYNNKNLGKELRNAIEISLSPTAHQSLRVNMAQTGRSYTNGSVPPNKQPKRS